jgi:xanthine dehydrogenase accessory factor
VTTDCLIRGTGDIGSAIAVALFRAGYRVILHDSTSPTYSRRGAAFVDALFDGEAVFDGVVARLCPNEGQIGAALVANEAIPVSCGNFASVLAASHPRVLVDARMRKRSTPEPQRGLAALTVGLGPNFVTGETTDLVIETAWGDSLGTLVTSGRSQPLSGEPKPVDGIGRERYVYAPAKGVFVTAMCIGDAVSAGTEVACIGEAILVAPISGRLRGLTRSGVPVTIGTKVIEVVPESAASLIRAIGARQRRIAEAVLQLVRHPA